MPIVAQHQEPTIVRLNFRKTRYLRLNAATFFTWLANHRQEINGRKAYWLMAKNTLIGQRTRRAATHISRQASREKKGVYPQGMARGGRVRGAVNMRIFAWITAGWPRAGLKRRGRVRDTT